MKRNEIRIMAIPGTCYSVRYSYDVKKDPWLIYDAEYPKYPIAKLDDYFAVLSWIRQNVRNIKRMEKGR